MNVFIKARGDRMPKVIEKVREQLLEEVRREIESRGYSKTTIRSVAEGCSISVGTVYNYFRSKDELVASAVAEDWKEKTGKLSASLPASAKNTVRLVYEALSSFEDEHRALFTDEEAVKKFASVFTEWHSVLRHQTAAFLLPVCRDAEDPDFLSLFLAEALLTWVTEGVPFEKLYSVMKKLIYKENDNEQL